MTEPTRDHPSYQTLAVKWEVWKRFTEQDVTYFDRVGRILSGSTASGEVFIAKNEDGANIGTYTTRKAAKAALVRLDYRKTQRQLADIHAAEQTAQREQ